MFLANIKFLIAVRYVPTKIAIICYVGILKKTSEISGHGTTQTYPRIDTLQGLLYKILIHDILKRVRLENWY